MWERYSDGLIHRVNIFFFDYSVEKLIRKFIPVLLSVWVNMLLNYMFVSSPFLNINKLILMRLKPSGKSIFTSFSFLFSRFFFSLTLFDFDSIPFPRFDYLCFLTLHSALSHPRRRQISNLECVSSFSFSFQSIKPSRIVLSKHFFFSDSLWVWGLGEDYLLLDVYKWEMAHPICDFFWF